MYPKCAAKRWYKNDCVVNIANAWATVTCPICVGSKQNPPARTHRDPLTDVHALIMKHSPAHANFKAHACSGHIKCTPHTHVISIAVFILFKSTGFLTQKLV